MFVVEALPPTYLEARIAEAEAAREKALQKARAPPACSSTSSSKANTPMSSPNINGNPGGMAGYFASWSRKAEGCAMPGSDAAVNGTMPTCKITSNHFR